MVSALISEEDGLPLQGLPPPVEQDGSLTANANLKPAQAERDVEARRTSISLDELGVPMMAGLLTKSKTRSRWTASV